MVFGRKERIFIFETGFMKRLHFILLSFIMLLLLHQTVCAQALPVVQTVRFKKDTFNIIKYGAVPDGMTLCSKAINAAIDACNKSGGGTVLVPGGLWLSGPIVLKSNTNLHLASNALLQFTSNFNEYPLVEG